MCDVLPYPSLEARPLGAQGLPALTDDALFAACGVRIAFTGRAGGVSTGPFSALNVGGRVGDSAEAVARNRAIALEALGASGVPAVVPCQVHGAEAICVERASDAAGAQARAEEGADAVVVGADGVAAVLAFADCLPLIIVSPSGRFAVVHAGWRGAVAHIASKAARQLARSDPFGASGFNAYIGPHIRSCCFEVGEDVAQRFAREFGASALADARHVSLSGAVAADLMSVGLDGKRIADAAICTACHPDAYFSYRATKGRCGRHAAAAVRV